MLEEAPESGMPQDFPLEWWRSLPPEKRRQVSTIMYAVADLDLERR